ncbi:MAG: hypothetical protein E7521_07610 [Ruminococcaceae bacterium]|nr:hypothetical protein [Oscillospiraceae bacterium]
MLDKNAKWIWINNSPKENEYAVFEEKFLFDGKKATFTVCAESDYVLYVNDRLAGFGQYAGYPNYKYYDELDITELCVNGENTFTLSVRYEGINTHIHIESGAGVIYTVAQDGNTVTYSRAGVLGGYDNRYIQNTNTKLSGQLGYSSDMRVGDYVCDIPCVESDISYNLMPRPILKTVPLPFVEGKLIDSEKQLYDLGCETAGYLHVKFKATKPGKAKIAYGQHITDGGVRYALWGREFAFNFELTEGEHEFSQYFIRMSGRYIQAFLPEGVEIISVGIMPYIYPMTINDFKLDNPLDQKIYDVCIRTLRLCMNMHYEDTPWREQALYVLDSRNQMLCGYYVFRETEFAKANIELVAKGTRSDGFLELTYPSVDGPAIPFFSVMYAVEVYEYIKYTGDKSILDTTMPTMLRIMNSFKSRIEKNNLIRQFDAPYWNFYEWTDGSADKIPTQIGYEYKDCFHLILNCAFVYAGKMFLEMCDMAGVEFDCDFDSIKTAINKEFFDESDGNFVLRTDDRSFKSQLGNSFALLIGLGDERTLRAIKEDKNLIETSLSMLIYKYDALLAANPDNKEYILNEIRELYGYMLDNGATTFWETIKGEADFGGAGSLCHGWSALPVYYYHLFNKQ